MRKILALVLVLGLTSMSFAVYEGFEDYDLDTGLNGQGTATGGWAGAWSVTHSSEPITTQYTVQAGGSPSDPDQHLGVVNLNSSAYTCSREFDTISGDWVLSYDLAVAGDGSLVRQTFEMQIQDAAGNAALQIKYGPSNWEMMILNDDWQTVQSGDGAFPNMKPLDEGSGWVSFAIEYDDSTGLFSLFWEDLDGNLEFHGPARDADSTSWDGTISRIVFKDTKIQNIVPDDIEGMLVDNIRIDAVPEPATLALLGLGALVLRRKR